MKQMLQAILAEYGSTVYVVPQTGTAVTVKAFLQPVTTRSWQNMQRVVRSLGEIPTGQFLYIGPTEQALTDTDVLESGGRRFRICRAETICLGEEELYVWALAMETGGECVCSG